jgi:hypothetical protein
MRFSPLDETRHPCTLHGEREHDENDRRTGLTQEKHTLKPCAHDTHQWLTDGALGGPSRRRTEEGGSKRRSELEAVSQPRVFCRQARTCMTVNSHFDEVAHVIQVAVAPDVAPLSSA